MNIIKVKDYPAMSEKACEIITKHMKSNKRSVLGLATGSTPEGLYEKLVHKNKQGEITFQYTSTFNLDEYIGLDKNNPNSYYYFMNEHLFKHIDIPEKQIHLPNGMAKNKQQECDNYEQLIKQAGNIDLQILGLGLNGHIGFNEPKTPFDQRTHIIELDESTRQANARFFNSIDDVPTEAITMGIATIMGSKKIVLLVSGEKKAETLAKVIQGEVTEDVPASILQKHADITVIADEAALSKTKGYN
ncbi:glucosamine-6-phosphate deaminase [Cerasibacillus terrae]|uniref:Glucosamine-6-phosphate deaminase n=1 Tax=Cerasibacillus terrae TaxID=2498845 RepID=A0A5C8NV65_9BACI|nr:glucosamine-6-phosphate deaminase [Cerasibacillus terrae]TXL65016.1 glucosamine-6-phosphate deaminase [Cerasibacillus terrae]